MTLSVEFFGRYDHHQPRLPQDQRFGKPYKGVDVLTDLNISQKFSSFAASSDWQE